MQSPGFMDHALVWLLLLAAVCVCHSLWCFAMDDVLHSFAGMYMVGIICSSAQPSDLASSLVTAGLWLVRASLKACIRGPASRLTLSLPCRDGDSIGALSWPILITGLLPTGGCHGMVVGCCNLSTISWLESPPFKSQARLSGQQVTG